MPAIEVVPICCMTMRSSRSNSSSTFSTPAWPKAPRPQEIGAPDVDAIGADRERLEDVRPAPEAAVHDHGHAAPDRGDDARQGLDRAAVRTRRAAAVVGYNDPVGAVADRELGVLGRDDSLHEDLHRRRLLQAVDGRVPVLVDSGFRRGTDIFKALALGASGICIGRPYLWGLGSFGQSGVERVLDILTRELRIVMQQMGTTSIAGINRSSLEV
jgi:hypothetical protein